MTYQQGSDAGYRPITSSDHLWLLAILGLGVALRIAALNSSLWYDEVLTLVDYVRLPVAEITQTYHSLNNHILFTLLAKLSVALFGESAWALRLPAMLFGVASIWALWRLAHEVVSPWQARMATLLMTVSYHHVWFSQNARGYTGLLFFGLVATWLLVRMLRQPSLRGWLCYGLCVVLSMYIHLSAAFLFLAHGLAFACIFCWRVAVPTAGRLPSLALPAIGCGLAIVVILALYAPILEQMTSAFGEVREEVLTPAAAESIAQWDSPLWMIKDVLSSFGAFGPLVAVVVPLVFIVLVIGMIGLLRTAPAVPLVVLIHVPLTLVILIALSFRVWPRYFLIDIGFLCLLLTHGAFVVGRWLSLIVADSWWGRGERVGITLAALGLAASLALLPKNYLHPKQDYRGAAAFVEGERSPDAKVITIGLGAFPFETIYAPEWQHAETLAEFESLYTPGEETWLVYTFPDVIEHRHADILDAAAPAFDKARYFHGTLADGGIVVLRSKGG